MSDKTFHDGRAVLLAGDCLARLKDLPDCSVDSVVTDPPYHLTSIVRRFGGAKSAAAKDYTGERENATGAYARASRGFMGKTWDGGDIAFRSELWAEVFRVLKPGGHVLAFSGTRTYHRMACAIEDAGFEIRDMVQWLYGSGFPKSHNISKSLDRMAGAEREVVSHGAPVKRMIPGADQNKVGWEKNNGRVYVPTETAPATDAAREWEGWGTALKPALEPICLARKPLVGTIAANVLAQGVGALNIDACRVGFASAAGLGRWPANVVHDGSPEVVGCFPAEAGAFAPVRGTEPSNAVTNVYGERTRVATTHHGDSGSAARFFSSFPMENDVCHSLKSASDAARRLSLRSERAVFALSNAAIQSTGRSAPVVQDYQAPNTNVSESELKIACEAVTEAIQSIERRCLLGLQQESITVRLGHVTCAATQNPTGTTMITASLLRSDRCVDHVTFNITETSADRGAGGSVAKRFHYSSKADADDRLGSKHPTVKPVDLMRWLVRLVTPPGGTVLDPFAGTGTTGHAALLEGFNAILIEREEEYRADIARRMALVFAGGTERAHAIVKARGEEESHDTLPLFGGGGT